MRGVRKMRQRGSKREVLVPYAQFRTGLTFREVYHMIYWRNWKRRHGVLGAWYQLKQAMYAEYLNDWQQAHRRRKAGGKPSLPRR